MNKTLKVGIVCYPSVGGSGIVATNLGLELSKLGHKVHFISYEPPFRLAKSKNIFFHQVHINEYSLFKYPDYTLPLAVEIEKIQKKYQLDILHVHYAVPHATAALLAKRIMRSNKIQLPKIITTLHGTDITLLARDQSLFEIIKYSVERSDGVTAVSQNLKKETLQLLQTKKNIEVIYNFYTPPHPRIPRDTIRKKLGITSAEILGIHLSNLRPVKRIPDLLKIVSRVKRSPFKLLILSGGDFGPYWKLAKKLGVEKNIIVKEKIQDIENYLNAADLGVYTSEAESFGMGALETMSYSCPVLATNTGGSPEVIQHEKNGFLHHVGDIGAFTANLKQLIQNTPLRQAMGKKAKQTACENFCSKKIIPKYLQYYTKILKQKNSP